MTLKPTIGCALLEDLDGATSGHGERPPPSGHLPTSPQLSKRHQRSQKSAMLRIQLGNYKIQNIAFEMQNFSLHLV